MENMASKRGANGSRAGDKASRGSRSILGDETVDGIDPWSLPDKDVAIVMVYCTLCPFVMREERIGIWGW